MRIKIIKDYRIYKKDQVLVVSPNIAFGLVDSGIAIVSKDMTPDDYKQAGDKDGNNTQLRLNKPRRR